MGHLTVTYCGTIAGLLLRARLRACAMCCGWLGLMPPVCLLAPVGFLCALAAQACLVSVQPLRMRRLRPPGQQGRTPCVLFFSRSA